MKALSLRKYKETVEIKALPFNRLRAHRYFPIAVMAIVVTAAACIHVWQRVVVISLAKEVAALEKDNHGLVDDAHKVQTEISFLSMTSRIERYAVDSLGLQRPRPDNIYAIQKMEGDEEPPDEFAAMLSSWRRLAEFLPERTEARAAAKELQPIRFDTVESPGAGE